MLEKERINKLRDKLNKSIEENEDYSIIYKLSVELDKLIAEYYENENKYLQNKRKYYEDDEKYKIFA